MDIADLVLPAASMLIAILQPLYTIYVAIMAVSPLLRPNTFRGTKTYHGASIAIVIPLYMERFESIKRSLESVARQRYPRDKLRVIIVVEEDDELSIKNLERALRVVPLEGIRVEVLRTSCRKKGGGKHCALNAALNRVKEEIYLVLDADDYVSGDYLGKVAYIVSLRGYTAVTTKVYREGDNIIAKFLTLDTVLWYDLALYTLFRIGSYIPLSGEGLAVKTSYLRRIGGFPAKLTEDAYLGMLLARDKETLYYLDDEFIVERAPRSFRAYYRQRLRWIQGYFECLADYARLLVLERRLGRESLSLLIPYFSPIVAMAVAITHTLFILYWGAYILHASTILAIYDALFPAPVFYWGLFNLVVGNLFLLYLSLYMVSDTRYSRLAPYALLMPLYWYLVGIIALIAVFAPRAWRKTER